MNSMVDRTRDQGWRIVGNLFRGGIKEGTFNLKAEADWENWTGFSQMKRTGEDR